MIDSGTQDEVYVGGYTSGIDSSSNRNFLVTLTQHSGADGSLRFAKSSNLGYLTNYYEMTNLNVYLDTTMYQTYIYGCSNDAYIDGYVGIHFFRQTTTNALPLTDRSLLLG